MEDSLPLRLDDLPLELLHAIVSLDEATYCGMLSIPNFARSIKPGVMIDYMIRYGYSVKINKFCPNTRIRGKKLLTGSIEWFKNEKKHTAWYNVPN